jgi:hypothetical protein
MLIGRGRSGYDLGRSPVPGRQRRILDVLAVAESTADDLRSAWAEPAT